MYISTLILRNYFYCSITQFKLNTIKWEINNIEQINLFEIRCFFPFEFSLRLNKILNFIVRQF